jgi:hypothetical protein
VKKETLLCARVDAGLLLTKSTTSIAKAMLELMEDQHEMTAHLLDDFYFWRTHHYPRR